MKAGRALALTDIHTMVVFRFLPWLDGTYVADRRAGVVLQRSIVGRRTDKQPAVRAYDIDKTLSIRYMESSIFGTQKVRYLIFPKFYI